jgi:ParB-like chromosome segregation protein Spo0J
MSRTVTSKQVSQMGQYEAHPYALLMPPLSDEEYQGLKASIATMGIKTPVELDEDSKILDGIHRCKIAAELGIDVPVNISTGLADSQKLELALGLNLYRRHLTGWGRFEIVAKLTASGHSVREIARMTGWSKSTVARDRQDFEVIAEYLASRDEEPLDLTSNPSYDEVMAEIKRLDRVVGLWEQQWAICTRRWSSS